MFHFYSHPVLEQLIFLGEEFWGQLAQALLGKFAIGGAAKVHFGIHQPMPAFFAETGGLILKEFYRMVANGAGNMKDRSRLPISAILTRTSHEPPPFPPLLRPFYFNIRGFKEFIFDLNQGF
jgi:hypothetical protein